MIPESSFNWILLDSFFAGFAIFSSQVLRSKVIAIVKGAVTLSFVGSMHRFTDYVFAQLRLNKISLSAILNSSDITRLKNES